MRTALLLGGSLMLVPACSDPALAPTDVGADATASDAAAIRDAGRDAAHTLDTGNDAWTTFDAGADAASGPDVGADAFVSPDAFVPPDAFVSPDVGSDAGPPLPDTCTASAQCGPTASCDTTLTPGRCVCHDGYAPCTTGCCAISLAREVTLPEAGHAPELGFDAAGNVYVLYMVGHDTVHLATIAPGDATTVVPIATTSGQYDAHDLLVEPDGTVIAAIHVDLGSRSGDLVLHTRAAGASTFTTRGLTTAARPSFAYDAAVGLSRSPLGQIYASVTERSGDGTRGMYISHFDPAVGSWNALANVLGYDGFVESELFAREDGFFIGLFGTAYTARYATLDPTGTTSRFISTTTGSGAGGGDYAAAMTDADLLYTFTSGFVSTSDGAVFEQLAFPNGLSGARGDLDMAIDRYGHPVFVTHSLSQHDVGFVVRMPHGGYALGAYSPETFFVTFPATTSALTLDAERAPSQRLAIAIGDSGDHGPLVYREYAY